MIVTAETKTSTVEAILRKKSSKLEELIASQKAKLAELEGPAVIHNPYKESEARTIRVGLNYDEAALAIITDQLAVLNDTYGETVQVEMEV